MDDRLDLELFISFPKPISTLVLRVSDEEELTCEAAILKCLSHAQEQMKLNAAQGTDIGITPYVPAFGLQITSREKRIFIPLHYKFAHPHNYPKEYRFCVRHIPPCPDIKDKDRLSKVPLNNLVWQLLILQGIEDFLWTKMNHGSDEEKLKEGVMMDLATPALIISNSDLPHDHRKTIDENFKMPNFSFMKYRKHFSKAFIKHLSTQSMCIPNRIFDYVSVYLRFNQWISHFKSENKILGIHKWDFIYNFLFYHPHYGVERYDVKKRADNGTLEDCSVEIRMNQRGKIQQIGLYLNRENKCSLAKIQQVIVKKQRDPENSEHEILIATESVEQSFKLIFKNSEELHSFVSWLQGTILLSVQPNLYLDIQLMPQSAIIKEQLRSFWSMRHGEASSLLSSSNMWKPEEERRGFLLYQDRDNLYNFTIATENKEDVKCQVQWTPKDKFTICQGGKALISYTEPNDPLRYFYNEYGTQLYPKLITKKQIVNPNSIYHLNLPEFWENEEEGSDETKYVSNSVGYVSEKDINFRSKVEVANENDDLKRFRVTIKGEDKLLVELQSRHHKARDAMIQNIMKMIQLWEASPKLILNFQQQAFVTSMKESFVFEYPTHGTLNMFLIKNRDMLSWLEKLRICLQVISVLGTLQSKELVHGNIRSSNFYVFKYDAGELVVKLGDPGLVYMYDDPQGEFQYLNKRKPWLAPERRNNLQCININTECYAIGTTLCEILHATDDFKSILKLRSDEDVMKFFRDGKRIPPPDLSYSENNPNTVMPEIRGIMDEAWKMVESCWNEDPNERPLARDLACKFRELIYSTSGLPFECLINYLRPVLSNSPGTASITPKDFNGLMEKQSRYFIKPEQVVLENTKLGRGHYGRVQVCRIWKQKKTGQKVEKEVFPLVAAKTLHTPVNNASMVVEIDMIASLSHDNVVKFLHFTFKEDKLVLIMEYLEEGSLVDFVKSISRKPDKESKKIQYFTTLLKLSHDVAKGMEYVHSQKIIHCDLAARNVLLYKDTQHAVTKIVAKVGDLGLAKIVNVDQTYYWTKRENNLPFCWCPPEYLIIDANSTSKLALRYEGDIWSFGVLLWEIFTLGRSPGNVFPRDEILAAKLRQGWRLPKELLQFDDEKVYSDLMMKCWAWNYKERPPFSELKTIIQNHRLSLEGNLSFA